MTQTTKIGVVTATIIGINAMIGSGIFTAPAAMATHVGPAGILAYLFVVGAIWFMAQSMARLAKLFPEEGSFYTYASQWGGHAVGMLAAVSYLIGLFIAMGLLSRVAGLYLEPVFPVLSPQALGAITLGSLIVLNMFGVALSQLGQHVLIACTVFPLIATTIMCFLKANPSNLIPFAPYGFGNVLKATRVVIFGFFGFESAASLFNIVKDPERNVPRALTYSILIVGTIYTLFIGSIIISTPLEYFTSPDIRVSDTLKLLFPQRVWVINLIHFSILSAIIGTIHSMIWGSSMLLATLWNKLKTIGAHAESSGVALKHSTAVLIVGLCIFTSFFTLTNINLFFNLTAIFIIMAFMLSMITLLSIKKEWESGNNIKTICGMITASMIFLFAAEGLIQEIVNLLPVT